MGNAGAKAFGMKEAPVTLKDSVQGIVDKVRIVRPMPTILYANVIAQLQIDGASRENTSGKFLAFDGGEIAW